jgi:FtsH-binding integral membrane protein
MKDMIGTEGGRKKHYRFLAVLAPALIGLALVLFLSPIAQDPAYHDFADERELLGIPFFGDVITNLAFVLAALHGLIILRRAATSEESGSFHEPKEKRAYLLFFASVLLTGFGSGWYHLHPDNASLFWDRLPMTGIFMSLFSIVITERINSRLGGALLWPLIVLGAASVVYWRLGERAGEGDLRFYALVQFYPMIAIPLILCLYPARYSRTGYFWGLALLYALAKAAELLDREIFYWNGVLSGHNLKHLLAALGAWGLAIMLARRRYLVEPD